MSADYQRQKKSVLWKQAKMCWADQNLRQLRIKTEKGLGKRDFKATWTPLWFLTWILKKKMPVLPLAHSAAVRLLNINFHYTICCQCGWFAAYLPFWITLKLPAAFTTLGSPCCKNPKKTLFLWNSLRGLSHEIKPRSLGFFRKADQGSAVWHPREQWDQTVPLSSHRTRAHVAHRTTPCRERPWPCQELQLGCCCAVA